MNKIKVFVFFCFISMAYLPAYAATSGPEWNQMQIEAVYQRTTQEMQISAVLDEVARVSNVSYIINLDINGKLFQQTLSYDSVRDILSANFTNFTEMLLTTYPFSYTIKSSKNNTQILYTYTGSLNFKGNVATIGSPLTQSGSTQTGTTSLSQDQKDAEAIYTIVMQNLPKSLTTTQSKINYLDDVIDSLEVYALKYPSRKSVLDSAISKFETQITAYKDPSVKRSYIPKYNSQAEEPKIINGIGNSPSYTSWRVD